MIDVGGRRIDRGVVVAMGTVRCRENGGLEVTAVFGPRARKADGVDALETGLIRAMP